MVDRVFRHKSRTAADSAPLPCALTLYVGAHGSFAGHGCHTGFTEHLRPPDESAPDPAARAVQPGRAGKVAVTGYFAPEVRRQLKRLAADADSTVRALLGEALNDLFAKHGVAEIAESDA